MQLPGWYLIAYDIAHPRRLQRLHRVLRAEALAVQESLFLVQGTLAEIEGLLDRLEAMMDVRDDDLRAYPVGEPASLWISGQGVIHGSFVCDGNQPRLQRSPPAATGWRHWLSASRDPNRPTTPTPTR